MVVLQRLSTVQREQVHKILQNNSTKAAEEELITKTHLSDANDRLTLACSDYAELVTTILEKYVTTGSISDYLDEMKIAVTQELKCSDEQTKAEL